MTRHPKITARWNKDLTVTLYANGIAVLKRMRLIGGKSDIDPFLIGWFGTEDRSQWRVRWVYA